MQEAVTFLTILLQDNQNMKNQFAKYRNTRVTFNSKHQPNPNEPDDEYKKRLTQLANDQENEELIADANNFRAYLTLANINFNSIKKDMKIKKEDLTNIESAYKHITTTLIPDIASSETYVQAINDLLAEYINVAALINAQDKASELARATE